MPPSEIVASGNDARPRIEHEGTFAPVNSRMLCQLSYRGRQPRDCSRASRRALPAGRTAAARPKSSHMRRFAVVGVAVSIGVLVFAPSGLAASARVAALQIGLRAHGFDPVRSTASAGRRRPGARSRSSAKGDSRDRSRRRDARALGARGGPLLGQRELGVGAVGWDVAVLEFRLRRYGLGARASTGGSRGGPASRCAGIRAAAASIPDGIAGPRTYRSLSRAARSPLSTTWHVVEPGESFFSIAARYHVSPWRLARRNRFR